MKSWKKIDIRSISNPSGPPPTLHSASSFFQKSRSFLGFANTLLLLCSRIKRDFRPPKIGNRTSRYFTPWNGLNPHCARNPGTKGGVPSSLLRQRIVLSSLSPSSFWKSGIFWVEWTPDITSSTKPKILFLSAVFRFCYAAADRWKSETDLTGQKVLESIWDSCWIARARYLQVQFSDWAIVIDFWRGRREKKEGWNWYWLVEYFS